MPEPGRRTLLKSGLLSIAGIAGWPSLSAAVQTSSTPYNRPKLKITEIRTAEVRVHGYQVHVRVYTDQGLFGQGESTDAAMGSVPLMRSFSRLLVGQDPLNVEAAFERIRTSGVFAGAQSGQYVTALTPALKSRSGIWPARHWGCRCISCLAGRCAIACVSTATPDRAR